MSADLFRCKWFYTLQFQVQNSCRQQHYFAAIQFPRKNNSAHQTSAHLQVLLSSISIRCRRLPRFKLDFTYRIYNFPALEMKWEHIQFKKLTKMKTKIYSVTAILLIAIMLLSSVNK